VVSRPDGSIRDPDIETWTTAELRDTRRDLAANLGLAAPASQAGAVIRAQIAAIDAEPARRPGTGREDDLPA
jgi:hypothetical protein